MRTQDYTQKERSDIYHNVSQCVLYLSDGEKITISNEETKEQLIVNILRCSPNHINFVNLVLRNYKTASTINELVHHCGYNCAKTFTRHFKRSFNTTPKQWLLSQKKTEVLYNLKNTDKPFKEIAKTLGFSNPSHFHDFCVKKIGQSPGKIRALE